MMLRLLLLLPRSSISAATTIIRRCINLRGPTTTTTEERSGKKMVRVEPLLYTYRTRLLWWHVLMDGRAATSCTDSRGG